MGIKRRRNTELETWLDAIDDTKWIDCPGGINTRERKTDPPRTRAQEIPSGNPDLRVIVIDSDERRGYERVKREQAMERARQKLEKLKGRVTSGDSGSFPRRSGLPSSWIMQKYHGHRYFDWKLNGDGVAGVLRERGRTSAAKRRSKPGRYVIMTSEKGLERGNLDAVALYKK